MGPPYQQKYATAMNILTETLERNTQLGSLVLEKTGLSGIAVSALADGLAKNKTGLHSLAIMDCTIGDIGAKAVARAVNMSAIVRLNVRGNKITKEGASALAKVHDQLKVFNTIPLTGKTLDLSAFTGLTVVEATVLRDVLRSDNPIESFDLGVYTMNSDLTGAMRRTSFEVARAVGSVSHRTGYSCTSSHSLQHAADRRVNHVSPPPSPCSNLLCTLDCSHKFVKTGSTPCKFTP